MYANFEKPFNNYFSEKMLRTNEKDKKKQKKDYLLLSFCFLFFGVMIIVVGVLTISRSIIPLLVGLLVSAPGILFLIMIKNIKDHSSYCQPNNCLNEVVFICVLKTSKARALDGLHNPRMGGVISDTIAASRERARNPKPDYDPKTDQFRVYAFTRPVSDPVLVGFAPTAEEAHYMANEFLKACPNAYIGDIDKMSEKRSIKNAKKTIGAKWNYSKISYEGI